MPWQTGVPVRTNSTFSGSTVWQDDAAAGTKILASNHDNHDQDLADMIGETLHRAGQNAILADIDWGGKRILNLAAPTVPLDAANKAYVDANSVADQAYTDAAVSALSASLDNVAFSGNYSDLAGVPALAPVATSGAYADLTGAPALAAVATSGAYADLSGAPSLAAVATSGDYNDLINRPTPGGTIYEMFTAAGVTGTTTTSSTIRNVDFAGVGPAVNSPVTPNADGQRFAVNAAGTYEVEVHVSVQAQSTNNYLHTRIFFEEDQGAGAWTGFGIFGHNTWVRDGTSPGANDRIYSMHNKALVTLAQNDEIRVRHETAVDGGLAPSLSDAYLVIRRVG